MATKKEEITEPPEIIEATISAVKAAEVMIRCDYDGEVIVTADKTLSGKIYKFSPGQMKPVLVVDKEILLGFKTQGGGCCGGGTSDPQYYFKEV